MKPVSAFAIIAALLIATSSAAADKKLVILFTGDNTGEIEPCGWHAHPTGGLARRATVIEQARREGSPVLLVDGGDALLRSAVALTGTAKDKEFSKAALIVSCMGGLGYAGMAVGERDLPYGYDTLVAKAKAAKLPLLSANLMKGDKLAFEAHRIVDLDGLKVGLFGLSMAPATAVDVGLTRTDPREAAKQQVAELRKEGAQLIVALGHLDTIEATSLLNAVDGIDFMIEAHNSRVLAQPQLVGKTYVMQAGERGRQILRLDVDLSGKGPFFDAGQIDEAKQRVIFLSNQIKNLQERIKREPQNADSLKQTVAQLGAQKEQAQKQSEAKPEGRLIKLTTTNLDGTIAFEDDYKRKVDAFVGKYGPTN